MAEVGPLTESTLFESSIIRLRLKEAIAPGFLVAYFFSRHGIQKRLAITQKATISGINQKGLLSLVVPVPSLSIQEELLARITAARSTISRISAANLGTQIDNLQSAILHRAFAGDL